MRPRVLLALALLSAPVIAHADSTITQNFTADGASALDSHGLQAVTATPISQFDPSTGTLNSITFDFSGQATSSDPSSFVGLSTPQHEQYVFSTAAGSGCCGEPYAFSTSGTFTVLLSDFEGTGTETLLGQFFQPVTTSNTSGTITYNFTPAASTPEPSSLALLGTGILGFVGVLRKRLL